MEGFCDSGKFKLKEIKTSDGMTHLEPIHHRDLGVKSGELYGAEISWAEVAINEVPLEKTFQYEREIQELEQENTNHDGRGIIMVNSRIGRYKELPEEVEEKKWVKRLEKIPMNSNRNGRKKKTNVERYPVKPKSTKQVRDEKMNNSSEIFHEIIDEKKGGESVLDYSVYIHRHGDYEVIKQQLMMTPSDPWWPPVYQTLKLPKYSIYCPPLHWLQPEVQWKKIWIHMNKLITGKERNYHYYPEGPNACGKNEPCIYFYDEDWLDKNYSNFKITTDYMDQTQYWNLNYP